MAHVQFPDPLTEETLLELILDKARHIHAVVVETNPEHHVDDTMLICTFMDEIQPAISAYRIALREQHGKHAPIGTPSS